MVKFLCSINSQVVRFVFKEDLSKQQMYVRLINDVVVSVRKLPGSVVIEMCINTH